MALENQSNNLSSLFSSYNKELNFVEKSSNDLGDLIKSLNIIDPDKLTKEQLSIILQRIDDYNGYYTTQQLENINYLNFNEHVFFDSAVSKITYAFDRIQNIPYDSDEIENIKFTNKTDGFTNYLLKNIYPSFKGYAKFNDNNFIVVYDEQGKILSDTTGRKKGILNPQNKNFSFDFWIKPDGLPSNENNRQVVFHKINKSNGNISNGYFSYIHNNGNNFNFHFCIYIDGNFIDEYITIKKDEWQHISINVSNKNFNNIISKKIDFVLNGNITDSISLIPNKILQNKPFNDTFKNHNIPFVIGGIFIPESNSILNQITHNSQTINSNFNGSIDEFRYFQKTRSSKTIKKEMHKNIFAQKGLKLYLRLNEPGGNYTNSFLCIDHSGSKIHGIFYSINGGSVSTLNNTTNNKINTETPLNLERQFDSPVLNSAHPEILTLRNNLIQRAKVYDSNNPNLIFNLMPTHYFLDNASLQNLPVYSNTSEYDSPDMVEITQDGNSPPTINPNNRSTLNTKIPANNDLVNIVLIWARFFDKLKLYISSITNILNVNYDTINQKKVIGMQIPILCKMYGIEFKEILPTITKNKLNNENLNFDDIVSDMSIRKIQNILWKRFLINTQDFLRSKGTVKSIESTFNAFGIDYKKIIDIKESSYDNVIRPKDNFSFREDSLFTVDFGNSKNLLKTPDFTNINQGYSNNKLFLQINNIKHKTGNNLDQSLISKNLNNNTEFSKGLNDNWSIEMFFNFKDSINKIEDLNKSKTNQIFSPNKKYNDEQYLFTLNTQDGAVVVVKYLKNKAYVNKNGVIVINIQPVLNDVSFNKTITLSNINIYDTPKYLCLKQKKENNTLKYEAIISDVGNQTISKNYKAETVEVTVSDLNTKIENNQFSFRNNSQLSLNIGEYKYQNNNSLLNSTINYNSIFQGEVLKIRLWSKELDSKEILSHYKDIENFGTLSLTPLKDIVFDFKVKNIQSNSIGNTKEWQIEDISNNKYYVNNVLNNLNTCKVFTKNINEFNNENVIKNISIMSKFTSSSFDEFKASNYVNIISYNQEENKLLKDNFNEFPANNVPYDFNYKNTNRVTIDMSIVKVINSDISKIISDIDIFTQKVSNSQSRFEYTYKSLESLRREYFNKFSDSNYINYSSLGNIFKYFDNIMSSILYDIVPSRVRFEGFNFVYESHTLERHKYEHKNKDSINTISSSIVMNTANATPDSFVNFSRDKIKSRRSKSYTNERFRPTN